MFLLKTLGEAVMTNTLCRLVPHIDWGKCSIYNDYGPAECTDRSTRYRFKGDESSDFVPIGRPFRNTCIYLLDKYMQAVIPGRQGEIVIGGKFF
jgi:non-ribosomal peptide synthetase component F